MRDSWTLVMLRRLRGAAPESGEQACDFTCRLRRAEQKSLHLVAAFIAQPIELVHRFHALGRRRDVETAAKAGNRPHDRDTIGPHGNVLDEGAVDLDLVEWKASQIAQAGIAGTEIVHRNADAKLAQL